MFSVCRTFSVCVLACPRVNAKQLKTIDEHNFYGVTVYKSMHLPASAWKREKRRFQKHPLWKAFSKTPLTCRRTTYTYNKVCFCKHKRIRVDGMPEKIFYQPVGISLGTLPWRGNILPHKQVFPTKRVKLVCLFIVYPLAPETYIWTFIAPV